MVSYTLLSFGVFHVTGWEWNRGSKAHGEPETEKASVLNEHEGPYSDCFTSLDKCHTTDIVPLIPVRLVLIKRLHHVS